MSVIRIFLGLWSAILPPPCGATASNGDWRKRLVPATDERIPWVDDAVGYWPVQERGAGLSNYWGPGSAGDLSALAELELAEDV